MTTTHISNERLEWLRDTLNDWISFYEDPADSENHAMFTDAEAAIDELLAGRQTIAAMSKQPPVGWTDADELRDMAKGGVAYMFQNGGTANKFADPRRQIMLYTTAPQPAALPDGYVLVPIEPTEDMVIAGFESEPDESFSEPEEWEAYETMSGCQQAAHKAKLCWAAMLAATPSILPACNRDELTEGNFKKK